jgi:hypothetical protein
MAIDLSDQLRDEQQLQFSAGAAAEANTLVICTGRATLDLSSSTRTYTFSVGPQLSRDQFHRAVASAAFSTLLIYSIPALPDPSNQMPPPAQCGIASVDADWDDERAQTQVRLETAESGDQARVAGQLAMISYTVHILARL